MDHIESLFCAEMNENTHTAYPKGILNESYLHLFKESMDSFYSAYPDESLLIDCAELRYMTSAAVSLLKEYASEGKKFRLENLNQDCYMGMFSADMEAYCGAHTRIPRIDIAQCRKIGEGSNGVVYAVNDKCIVKVFKKEPDFDSMLREREVTGYVLKLGIRCPENFGYALVDGKAALLEEYIRSTSFLKLIRADRSNIKKYIKDYVGLIKKLHGLQGDETAGFPHGIMLKEILQKADGLDSVLDGPYRGKLRKMVEAIDDPEVLIHGDIQPNNIRISDNGAGLIDLETLSTGPAVIDLGALRRTLFSEVEISGMDRNDFLGLPADDLYEIWNSFTQEYFRGEDAAAAEKMLFNAKAISYILAVSKIIRTAGNRESAETAVVRLRELINEWDSR